MAVSFIWTIYILISALRNFFTNDAIFTHSYAKFKGLSPIPNNWGDDINKYFIEYVTGKKVIVMNISFPIKHYVMIGSILSFFRLNGATVYGTGLMTASYPLRGVPRQIISVRGPLTRKAVLQSGIDCPEHYGDPALLLPLFFKPKHSDYDVVSVIPNEGTFWNPAPIVDELTDKYGCRLVNMTRYECWTDIIDAITSSCFVISESLHGLIVAESYGIPSIWVEFIDHTTGKFNPDWSFKFRDFYESIGKHNMTSIKLYEGYDFNSLLKERDNWQPGRIDYAQLLEDFPFSIRPELLPITKIPLKP